MSPLEQYNSIVDYWRKNPLKRGGEVHHIIPRSCGGCDKKWNKVRMPTLEHIKCHRILCDIYPTGSEYDAMATAYDLMLTTREGVKVSEEEAARARDEAHKASSRRQKGRIPWNKGKTGIYSEETLAAIRAARARQVCTDETRAKMSKAHTGKPHVTEDGKRRCREANLGRVVTEETRQLQSNRRKEYWASIPPEERKRGPISEEARRKMSEAKKGKPSPNKGRHLVMPPWTEERRQKVKDTWAKKRQAKRE